MTARTGTLAGICIYSALTVACGRFDIRDARDQIAMTRQCRPFEVSLVEYENHFYEESGCGVTSVYRCQGRQCRLAWEGAFVSRTSAAGAAPSVRLQQGQGTLQELEPRVLSCSANHPVIVQAIFNENGVNLGSRVVGGDAAVADCITRLIETTRVARGVGGMVLSRRFPQAPE